MEHTLSDKESLSDKEKSSFSDIDELRNNDNINFYHEEDVKKFIRTLREKFHGVFQEYPGLLRDFKNFAGDRLI